MENDAANLMLDEERKFKNFWKLARYTMIKIFSAGIKDQSVLKKIEEIVDKLIDPREARAVLQKINYENLGLITKALRRIKYNIRCNNHTDPPLCKKFIFTSEILEYFMALKALSKCKAATPTKERFVNFKNKKNLDRFLGLCADARREFLRIRNLLVKIFSKLFRGGAESVDEGEMIDKSLQALVVYGVQEFLCLLSPATLEKMISELQTLQDFLAENVYGASDQVLNSAAWKVSQMFMNYFAKLEAVISFERFIDSA